MGETSTPYSYVYDALNRLTQVLVGGCATESYTYDALGNRLTKTDASGTVAYVYDAANQLKEIHQNTVTGPLLTSLSYDDSGNLVSKSDAMSGTVQISVHSAFDDQAYLAVAEKPLP